MDVLVVLQDSLDCVTGISYTAKMYTGIILQWDFAVQRLSVLGGRLIS